MESSSQTRVEIPDTDVTSFVLEHAGERAGKPALIDGPSGRTLTYGELANGVRALAAGLAARGFGKGDVLAVYMPNLPEYAIAFHGTASAGGRCTTVNPLYTANELTHQLEDSGAKFLLTVPPFLDAAREAAERAGIEQVFVVGEGEGSTPFAELLGDPADAPEVEIDSGSDLAVLPYSSGTTGLPKGVMLTHRNLVANLSQVQDAFPIEEDDTLIGCLPFFHIYGMTVIMNQGLRAGATIVTMPRFDLDQFLGLLEEHGVTLAYVVPPIALALGKHPAVDGRDLSSLRIVASSGSALPVPVVQEWLDRVGPNLYNLYGSTEVGQATLATPEDLAGEPATAGRALPGSVIAILDEGGTDVEPGTIGRIFVGSGAQFEQYTGGGGKEIIGGLMSSGDVGYLRPDGLLFVTGRADDMIVSGGENVFPREVEDLLLAHPAIDDVAVVGVDDPEFGQRLAAYVVKADGARLSATAVRRLVSDTLARHKTPRDVHFVSDLPRTVTGKIRRNQLDRG